MPGAASTIGNPLAVGMRDATVVGGDSFVAEYAGDGTLAWSVSLPLPVAAVGIDAGGYVYAAGTADSSAGGTVYKLSPSGALEWERFIPLPAGATVFAPRSALPTERGVMVVAWCNVLGSGYSQRRLALSPATGDILATSDGYSYPTDAIAGPWGGSWNTGWIWGGFYDSQVNNTDTGTGWGFGDEYGPVIGMTPEGDVVMATNSSSTNLGRIKRFASGRTPLWDYQWGKMVYQVDLAQAVSGIDFDGRGLMYALGGGVLSQIRVTVASDADGDGYPTSVDCDDANAAVHPGATEIVGDGIDQDCNGFDSTIAVKSATWRAGILSVSATSRSAAGNLQVLWYGAMTAGKAGSFSFSGPAPVAPARVWVMGPEGAVAAPVRLR